MNTRAARVAVSLYVALALHLLLALGLGAPPAQLPRGAGVELAAQAPVLSSADRALLVHGAAGGSTPARTRAARATQDSEGGGAGGYLARLRQHLSRHARELPDLRGPLRADLRVDIGADGRVLQLALERSSGNAMLDSEALAWVRRAQPLPPPPQNRPLRLSVPVEIAAS